MKRVPAKVGTIPMVIDIRYKRRLKAGDRVQWRKSFLNGDHWKSARVLEVVGDPAGPEHVFLERF
jgi:hypothetical protein